MESPLRIFVAALMALGLAFAAPALAQSADDDAPRSNSPLDDNWAEPDWSEGADGPMRHGPGMFSDEREGGWTIIGRPGEYNEDAAAGGDQGGPVKVERRRR